MNKIKARRERLGLTQKSLAEKSGLSLRTIQRMESGKHQPKGHSLLMLAQTLELDPVQLRQESSFPTDLSDTEKSALRLINLSTLGFFILPFGNLLFPYLIWRRKRKTTPIDKPARSILNIQILWTLFMIVSLSSAPFLGRALSLSSPLILWVLFLAIGIKLFLFFRTAQHIQNGKLLLANQSVQLV